MNVKMSSVFYVLVILGIIERSYGYRILGIYASATRSSFILINEIFKGLVEEGHKVDVINIFSHEEKHPNYTQILKLPNFTNITMEGISYDFAVNIMQRINTIGDKGYDCCKTMGTPEFLDLARNPPRDPPYDIIITQMMNYHCFMILGHLWNVPVILVSTTSLYPWMHDMIGNPENVAFSSNNAYLFKHGNSFWKRFHNFYLFNLYKLSYLYYSSNQNELLKKYFGPDVPSIRELERNVSLVLVNSYFPINGAKPTTTAVIEVGGLHIHNESSELTDDLKKWLDESENGVIYFSFGSIIRIETIPEEILTIIFKSLENIAPTRVLIRIVNFKELSLKIPKNFYILSWIPQQKVLQHPNVKAFITHGGLLGTQESVYFGIPMLCIPIFYDQFTNTNNYVEKEVAVMIDLKSITREKFDYAVNEILNNPIYRMNIKKLSSLFKDRPLNAMDTAIFWIKYVIRNGKDSLRSPIMDLTWWQVALLDVYAVIFSIFLTTLFITVFIAKKLFCLYLCTKSNIILSEKKRS